MIAVWQLDRIRFRDVQYATVSGGLGVRVVNTARVPENRGRLMLTVGVFCNETLSNIHSYLAIAPRETNGIAVPFASRRETNNVNMAYQWLANIVPFFLMPQETILFEGDNGTGAGIFTIRTRFIDFDLRKTGPKQLEEIREVFPQ